MNCAAKQKICEENGGQQMVKRLKLDSELNNNMTILNVIDDCLVEIFVYLSLEDLLNVGATNSRFKISTERAFVRKHLDTSVIVSNIDTDTVDMLAYSINILKLFGHCITKLCIKFELENIGRLLEAVVTYSGNTIIKLKFCHEQEDWYMKLHRTGLRRIKRQLRDLKLNFPNLLNLKFEYNEIIGCPYSDDIIQAIPTLTSFSASGLMFSHEDVDTFIALNGQLESLKLFVYNGFITQTFINNLDASLPRLRSLKLSRVNIEGTLDAVHPDRFKRLRKLTFARVSAPFPVNALSSLFGEEIEELELSCYDYVISGFIESISRFRKLKKLCLYFPPHVTTPSLLTFDTSMVSPGTIRELILRSNQLTKIEIDWHYPLTDFKSFQNKYNVFKDKLQGAQWHVNVLQYVHDEDERLIRICVSFSKEKEN